MRFFAVVSPLNPSVKAPKSFWPGSHHLQRRFAPQGQDLLTRWSRWWLHPICYHPRWSSLKCCVNLESNRLEPQPRRGLKKCKKQICLSGSQKIFVNLCNFVSSSPSCSAANTTIVHLDDLFCSQVFTSSNQLVIDSNLAELVLNHRETLAMCFLGYPHNS